MGFRGGAWLLLVTSLFSQQKVDFGGIRPGFCHLCHLQAVEPWGGWFTSNGILHSTSSRDSRVSEETEHSEVLYNCKPQWSIWLACISGFLPAWGSCGLFSLLNKSLGAESLGLLMTRAMWGEAAGSVGKLSLKTEAHGV